MATETHRGIQIVWKHRVARVVAGLTRSARGRIETAAEFLALIFPGFDNRDNQQNGLGARRYFSNLTTGLPECSLSIKAQMPLKSAEFSTALRTLIGDLQAADGVLKADPDVEGHLLRELRHALDNLRLTAWTVSELQNARDAGKNTHAMVSFLAGERVRRIRQLIDDLSADLEGDGKVWPAGSIDELQTSVRDLRKRLAG
jgi:hypothetical protein